MAPGRQTTLSRRTRGTRRRRGCRRRTARGGRWRWSQPVEDREKSERKKAERGMVRRGATGLSSCSQRRQLLSRKRARAAAAAAAAAALPQASACGESAMIATASASLVSARRRAAAITRAAQRTRAAALRRSPAPRRCQPRTSLAFLCEMAALISSTCGTMGRENGPRNDEGREDERVAALSADRGTHTQGKGSTCPSFCCSLPLPSLCPPQQHRKLTLSQAAAHSPAAPPSQTCSASLMASCSAFSCGAARGRSAHPVDAAAAASVEFGARIVSVWGRDSRPRPVSEATLAPHMAAWRSRGAPATGAEQTRPPKSETQSSAVQCCRGCCTPPFAAHLLQRGPVRSTASRCPCSPAHLRALVLVALTGWARTATTRWTRGATARDALVARAGRTTVARQSMVALFVCGVLSGGRWNWKQSARCKWCCSWFEGGTRAERSQAERETSAET